MPKTPLLLNLHRRGIYQTQCSNTQRSVTIHREGKASSSRSVNKNHWKPAMLFRRTSRDSDLYFAKSQTWSNEKTLAKNKRGSKWTGPPLQKPHRMTERGCSGTKRSKECSFHRLFNQTWPWAIQRDICTSPGILLHPSQQRDQLSKSYKLRLFKTLVRP